MRLAQVLGVVAGLAGLAVAALLVWRVESGVAALADVAKSLREDRSAIVAALEGEEDDVSPVAANVDAGERRVLTDPRVIDGDTVVDQDVRYRLAGIDAPGVRGGRYGARCEAERMLGRLAAQRVEHLLSGAARAEIKLNGMKDPQRGPMQERLHGLLLVDGRDVGALLLAEGLAQRYEQRRGWCNGL